jgi:hypothetical protein
LGLQPRGKMYLLPCVSGIDGVATHDRSDNHNQEDEAVADGNT